jgi:hypothetical protein
MSDTVPVPPALVRGLWYAVGAAVPFIAVTAIQGLVRPGYDSWHQAVSALSLGPGGWVQVVNLVAFGVVVAMTAPIWRRILAGGKGATAYPALTAVIGVSFCIVGLVPQDPAPGYDPMGLALDAPTARGLVHLAVAGVAALCSVASLFVMAARFAGDRHWPGWPAYSRVMALLVITCVTIYGVWSTRASGLAGTFERLAILIPLVWTVTVLHRLGAGTPFMVVPRSHAFDADTSVASTSTLVTRDDLGVR